MTPTSAALRILFLGALLAVPPSLASAQSAPGTQDQQAPLNRGQLDAVLAPVALYPDPLLSKILIASTFPDQVLDAANWRKNNPALKGDALDRAIAGKAWDDNVKALTRIPGVLEMMSGQQDWMYQLGGAFVEQQSDVMASVQRLRRQAQAHGSLKTTSQQRVVQQGSDIVIEPAQPQVVYVPYYNPTVVYGTWAYPAYRPYYWATPYGPGYAPGAFAAGLAWGTGVAISAAIWSNAFDWHNHNVYYGGGWHGHGSWNRGYYNNWHSNSYRRTNVNIRNNTNVNRNRNANFNNNRRGSNRVSNNNRGNRAGVNNRRGGNGVANNVRRGQSAGANRNFGQNRAGQRNTARAGRAPRAASRPRGGHRR